MLQEIRLPWFGKPITIRQAPLSGPCSKPPFDEAPVTSSQVHTALNQKNFFYYLIIRRLYPNLNMMYTNPFRTYQMESNHLL